MTRLLPVLLLVVAVAAMLACAGTSVSAFPNDDSNPQTAPHKDSNWYSISGIQDENVAGNGTGFIRLGEDDPDGDGLNDTEENWWTTDPNNGDTDGDGVSDGEEVARILAGDRSSGPPFSGWPDNSTIDRDWDSVPDLAETNVIGTNPNKASTDGDKYDDGQELFGISEASGSLPGYVLSPGDDVFVAAYPEIKITISDQISVINVQKIMFETRNSTITTQGYEVGRVEGTSTSTGTTEGYTKSEWVEVGNEEEDVSQKTNYQESITNTETQYWKGYTEGQKLETERAMHADVGWEVGFIGPAPTGSVSGEVGIVASVKNTVEHGNWGSNYEGKSQYIKRGGEEVSIHMRGSSIKKGSSFESSFATTITKGSYHETIVTNSHSIANGTEWATATTTDPSHAANLKFKYYIENPGSDIAQEVKGIVFNIFIGDETIPITYYASNYDIGETYENLKPGDKVEFSNTPDNVPMTLAQLRAIDEGAPITIRLEDYSYGEDELFYESAKGDAVLFEIDDGIADGDEDLDNYMIPTWGDETFVGVLKRAVPVTIENNNLASINNLPITEWSWWNIYLQNNTDKTKFIDEKVPAKSPDPKKSERRVLMRYYKDSDHDYYTDRTELRIGTDPNNVSSHPSPNLTVGAYYEKNGTNMTVKLKLSNAGNYDAYGIEARLYSPDNTTTVYNALIGGGGRVKAGETVIVSNDTFVFTNTTTNYTEPVIIVYYNDPQGHHKFVTPVRLADINDSITGKMIYEPELVTETLTEYIYEGNNSLIISYNNPHNETIEDAKMYIGYQNLTGHLFHQINITADLVKGTNLFIARWNPSENISQDYVGETIKVVTLVTG